MREEQWDIERKLLKLCIGITKRFAIFFEFCCGITEKIDVDDWTNAINSHAKFQP
jgi:hypothetical protein